MRHRPCAARAGLDARQGKPAGDKAGSVVDGGGCVSGGIAQGHDIAALEAGHHGQAAVGGAATSKCECGLNVMAFEVAVGVGKADAARNKQAGEGGK